MLITNPYVRFEMIVENAQFNFSSPCNQPFADISLLNDIDKEIDDFMTLELNKSVLNSELDTIDNIHNIAFLSNSLSDSNWMGILFLFKKSPIFTFFHSLIMLFLFIQKFSQCFWNNTLSYLWSAELFI